MEFQFLEADTARRIACKASKSDVVQLLEWIKPKIAEAAELGKFSIDVVLKSSDLAKNFKVTDKTAQKRLVIVTVSALEKHGYAADYSVNADGFVSLDNCPNLQFTIKISWD